MSSNKKYFWLKLKDDFFRQKEIKKLRKIAGGDTFTIIYLKLQLLSLKNEGRLYFDNIEDEFAEEIALELDEDSDNVKMTLMFLQKHGMLELVNNDEYLLKETIQSIGSESTAAERMRRMREKKNVTLLQPVTNELHRDRDRTRTRAREDIDLEKRDRSKSKEQKQSTTAAETINPFSTYQNNIGLITSHIADRMKSLLEDGISQELMSKYIEVATERNKRTWAYIEKMAQGNLESNIKTLDQYEASCIERQNSYKTGGSANGGNQHNIESQYEIDSRTMSPEELGEKYKWAGMVL
jgi:predicted phage replisome organizer